MSITKTLLEGNTKARLRAISQIVQNPGQYANDESILLALCSLVYPLPPTPRPSEVAQEAVKALGCLLSRTTTHTPAVLKATSAVQWALLQKTDMALWEEAVAAATHLRSLPLDALFLLVDAVRNPSLSRRHRLSAAKALLRRSLNDPSLLVTLRQEAARSKDVAECLRVAGEEIGLAHIL